MINCKYAAVEKIQQHQIDQKSMKLKIPKIEKDGVFPNLITAAMNRSTNIIN